MEIQQVRYFLEVCSEHNFTRAAKKCGIAQPSLTRAIQLLEKEFGGPLFFREHGKAELTELGRTILPYLQNVWEQTTAVKKLTDDIASRRSAKVRLGVMCTIAPKLLITTLANFRRRHPHIEFEIVDGTAAVLEQQLLGAEIDVAIYARPMRSPNARLNYIGLFHERMVIILPKEHRLAESGQIRASELANENYVMRSTCEFAELPEDPSEPQKSMWTTVYKSDRDDWISAMVASGFGFGFAARNSVPEGELAVVPLVEPELWREVHLTTVVGRPHNASVGALIHEVMNSKWPNRT